MNYIIARLKEASTWRGLIIVVTAATGATVPPELEKAIVLCGLALAGFVGTFFPDSK